MRNVKENTPKAMWSSIKFLVTRKVLEQDGNNASLFHFPISVEHVRTNHQPPLKRTMRQERRTKSRARDEGEGAEDGKKMILSGPMEARRWTQYT